MTQSLRRLSPCEAYLLWWAVVEVSTIPMTLVEMLKMPGVIIDKDGARVQLPLPLQFK